MNWLKILFSVVFSRRRCRNCEHFDTDYIWQTDGNGILGICTIKSLGKLEYVFDNETCLEHESKY